MLDRCWKGIRRSLKALAFGPIREPLVVRTLVTIWKNISLNSIDGLLGIKDFYFVDSCKMPLKLRHPYE